jgi:hypothetical protein
MRAVTSASRSILLITAAVISVGLASAQQSETVTITEPAVMTLANLYKLADTVVVAKILSGDTENYKTAVYKAEVVRSFKGAAAGDTIYVGPYIGDRLGSEYVLFLRNMAQSITPKTTSSASYGSVRYAEAFNEGYSSMAKSYECVFDGRIPDQSCDYGVRVCTDYVVLPKEIRTFPPMGKKTPFGCRLVREKAFISLLETLADSGK